MLGAKTWIIRIILDHRVIVVIQNESGGPWIIPDHGPWRMIQNDPRVTFCGVITKVFGDEWRKRLYIPVFIDDYNHHMHAVDLADQLRAGFTTTRRCRRTWRQRPSKWWRSGIRIGIARA